MIESGNLWFAGLQFWRETIIFTSIHYSKYGLSDPLSANHILATKQKWSWFISKYIYNMVIIWIQSSHFGTENTNILYFLILLFNFFMMYIYIPTGNLGKYLSNSQYCTTIKQLIKQKQKTNKTKAKKANQKQSYHSLNMNSLNVNMRYLVVIDASSTKMTN